MYGKILSLCAFALVALGAVVVQAADPTLTITDSGIDWSTIAEPVVKAVMTPAIVGIGIGLSVWVVMVGVRFFRRAAN